MSYVLSKRILQGFYKEELATHRRYVMLGKKYKIPELVRAGNQEYQHAMLFKKLLRGLR